VVAPATANFKGLFTVRDFTVLWIAGTQSQVGDQLARVALSILVFAKTGSGLATAATYALTYLPAVAGGILLTGLADTLPRRSLLIACDVLRAGLFALMAIPSMPLWLVCVLLVIAVLAGSPYNAAEPALVADIFEGDEYVAAQGLRTATTQCAQLAGFAVGGLIVALTGSRTALLIDAITFAASAVLLRVGLELRPPASTGERHRGMAQIKLGIRTVAGNRQLRILLAFAWLYAWWVIPEGLAAPYAAAHGGGPTSVGVLLAAAPAGNVLGVIVVTRWVPSSKRPQLLGVLAIATGIPLVLCGFDPGIAAAALLWGLCGFFGAYVVLVVTEFVAVVPSRVRGHAIGLASAGLLAAQGLGLLIGGLIASVWAVAPAIAVAGAVGSVLAVPLAVSRRRLGGRRPQPMAVAYSRPGGAGESSRPVNAP
jgi:predicted MFS family arabinose efflux permease